MIRSRRLFLFLSLQLSCVNLIAQSLITAYSVEEGLPQSTVMALYRDNSGFLWCGTGAGLGLYDGWEFHTPVSDGKASEAEMHDAVRGIVPSLDQRTVWVGTESSLLHFDRFSARVLRSYNVVGTLGSAEVPVFANDTAVWVLCWGHGLFRMRIADGVAVQITNNSVIDQHGVTEDQQTIVFRDTSQRFVLYNLVSGTSTFIDCPSALSEVTTGVFVSIPGKSEELLFTSSRGLWSLNIKTRSVAPLHLSDPDFNDSESAFIGIAFHPDGSWWLSVLDKGVYRYDPLVKRIRPCHWQQDGKSVNDLLKFSKSIVCDEYGVVWLGTDGAGLVKILHGRIAFSDKFIDPFVTDTCNWFVRSFYEMSPRRYLVGTFREGIRLVDHNTEKITTVSSGPLWKSLTPYFITNCEGGYLLSGTEQKLLLIDTVNWSTREVAPLVEKPDQRFKGFLKLKSGKILVYGNYGVFEFRMLPEPALIKQYGDPIHVTDMIELSDGKILAAGYHKGIQEISEDGKFIRYYDYQNWLGLPSATVIHGMFQDSRGDLWVGSQSGLHLLDQNLKLQKSFTVDEGLPDNTIYDLIGLDSEVLCLATGHGLALFNISDFTIRTFHASDGLPSEECNTGGLLYTSEGMLYVGTTEGFIVAGNFDKAAVFKIPTIRLSYGYEDDISQGILSGNISKDYGSGPLKLRVWVTDFAFPEQTLFRYKLEGAENDYIEQKGLRYLNYSALEPGSFSLLCSVSVPGSARSEVVNLLTVSVIPPYWKSTWFLIVMVVAGALFLSLIAFVLIRISYSRKLQKLKLQQEIEQMRQRISRDIHDEIGAGLTRIALSGDLIAMKQNADPDVTEKLKWISGTARDLSQNMKEVVWSVNPHYDSLDHMAAYFRSYVAGVAEDADLKFIYRSGEQLPELAVSPETRRNLLLILKESVSNAVKYSGCTELTLEIRWSSGKLFLKLSDNGSGFDTITQSEKVNSNGLRNMRQRAETIRCSCTLFSEPGKGTSVTIEGPVAD